MTLQIALWFFIFFLGLIIGRYGMFRNRPKHDEVLIAPTQTVHVENFKGNIYKAMASRLKREGIVTIKTKDPAPIISKIAKAGNVAEASLIAEPYGTQHYKIRSTQFKLIE